MDRPETAPLEDPDQKAGVLIVVVGDERRDLSPVGGILRHALNITLERAETILRLERRKRHKGNR